jgi:hypothetical protein
MDTKSRLHPVWTEFNYIAHRKLKSGYELRQCLVSEVVALFANLSSHLHSSWRQITHLKLIYSRIGRNPNGSIKTAHPKSRTRTVSQGPFTFLRHSQQLLETTAIKRKKYRLTRLIKSLEINPLFD